MSFSKRDCGNQFVLRLMLDSCQNLRALQNKALAPADESQSEKWSVWHQHNTVSVNNGASVC